MIICFTFLTLGIFMALSNNIRFLTENVSDDQVVVFYLKDDLSENALQNLRRDLDESGLFKDIRVVTRDKAMEEFRQRFPDLESLLDTLDRNPFPSSVEAVFRKGGLNAPESRDVLQAMREREGVSDIQYNQQWIERMKSVDRLVKAVGLFLGSILLFASFFIISNVIKLNVLARKNEISILRLVGARNWFIRFPFLMEGLFLGLLGGLLAALFLWILTLLFPLYLGASPGLIGELFHLRFLTGSQIFVLLFGGSVIGVLGSFSSLSKFLKI